MSDITQEVLYPGGGRSEFRSGGGSFHDGDGITRLRLLSARSALKVYIESGGQMQITRNGNKAAVVNVIEPLSGKRFTSPTGRLSFSGCRKALVECERLIRELEGSAVVLDTREDHE